MQSVSRLRFPILVLVLLVPHLYSQSSGATFGEVVSLGGTPSDIVLDENRQRLYLVNSSGNRLDIFDYSAQALIGQIGVGQNPLAAAMSMDGALLYVTNHDDSSLTVISLTGASPAVVNTVALPAKPQGLEVGADGRVLIATDGSGTNSLSNTLLLFDGTQAAGNQVLPVAFPPPAPTPPSLQPITGTRSVSQFNGRLVRTPDGRYIIGFSATGITTTTNSTTSQPVIYVYETASGTLLASRTIGATTTLPSSVLSMAPDGASFMAGATLYDTATLNVIGQQSSANAPFIMPAINTTTSPAGGSVFSPDGKTLYSAFNVASAAGVSQSNILLISDPRSLGIQLGINLPESVQGKLVITSDASQAWALSSSGIIHLPLGNLFSYPILMPDTTTVFLRQDDCNLGMAQTAVHISNIGGGRLTFAVQVPAAVGQALIVNATSGLAPSSINFTMDPGRSTVIRSPGTNIFTGSTGAPINVTLLSSNAINVLPTIRVFMNYRDSTMRGIVYPVPTVPNTSTVGNEGLQDIVLDEARNRVYITNSGYNRIEVFDIQKMAFQAPLTAGQLPHQMALGLDGSTLFVANTGSETVSTVDLDQQQVTGKIQFPPIPRVGTNPVTSVQSMAAGVNGLQMVRSDGYLWTLVGNQAVPRRGTTVTGVTAQGAQQAIAAPRTMLTSNDGSYGVLLGGTGTVYLYDGLRDAYTQSSRLFGTSNPVIGGLPNIIGYYGPLGVAPQGKFLLANGLIMNQGLTPIGGAASPGQVGLSFPTGPGQPITINVTTTGLRNIAAVAPVDQRYFVRMSTAVRNSPTATTSDDIHTIIEAIDTQTGATAMAARIPENPTTSVFSTQRSNVPPRQMVVDSKGTVYALTLSGLSVLPLTPANSGTQPQIAGSQGVINANDGSGRFQPGSFVNITGTNLAANTTADTLPPPTVLGGSCVLVDGVALPLLSTSPNQISAQLPASIRPGANVIQVRSLAMAQQSNPVVVTIQKP